MKSSIMLFAILAFLSLNSCNSSKNQTSNKKNVEETVKQTPEQMERETTLIEAGYAKGKVVDMKNDGGCEFVIKLIGETIMLNPIEWIEPSYKKDGITVYFKYRLSRSPQTTCLESTPIVLEEIKMVE